MNFNFAHGPDSQLNSHLIDEVIALYGIDIKFLLVEYINKDETIFKDFQHIKTDEKKIFNMKALPENSESFDNTNYSFADFGFLDFDNINLFIHTNEFKKTGINLNQIIGNIIVLPSNKVMEITDLQFMVPGINNAFTEDSNKSVYRVVCRPYEFKNIDEIDHEHLKHSVKQTEKMIPDDILNNYDALDDYFNEILKDDEKREYEVEVQPAKQQVQETEEIDEMGRNKQVLVDKPMFINDEKDIWGQFK